MRLLFRHLRRSVFAAPKESIVLLLTVFLSAVLFISSTEVYFAVQNERRITHDATYGEADLGLTGFSENGTRFVTTDALSSVSDDCRSATGVLTLPVTMGDIEALSGAASLREIGNFFSFSFTEVTPLPDDLCHSAVYVTESFAEENGLSVGDEITLSILGKAESFTVYGIQKYSFFNRYDLILEIEGVLRVLQELSPLFLVFDEESMPYTDLYVMLKDGVSPHETVNKINKSAEGANAYAYSIGFDSGDYIARVQQVIFVTILLCTLLVASVFVVFSLRILSEKRQKEYESFRLAGMTENAIFCAFSLEVFLYLFLGTAAGIPFSFVVLPAVFEGVLVYAPVTLSAVGILFGISFELLVGICSLLAYRLFPSRGGAREGKRSFSLFLFFLAAAVLSAAAACLLPISYRYIAALFLLVFLLFTLFTGVPHLLRLLSRRVAPLFIRKKKASPAMYLAMKNNGTISEMRHLHGILSAVLSLLVIPIAGVLFCGKLLSLNQNQITCEYIVSGAGSEAVDAVSALSGTEAVTPTYLLHAMLDNGQPVVLISAADTSFFADLCETGQSPPAGNGIYLAPATAARLGVSLGDTVAVYLQKSQKEFTLTGYTAENSLCAYINAEGVGFAERMLLVKSDGSAEYLTDLAQELSLYGAFVEPINTVFSNVTATYQVFSQILEVYLVLFLLLALIGCANLIYVGYARRKEHFRVLALSGMTRKDICRMIAAEGGLLLFAVAVLSFVCGTLFLGAFDLAMRSYGFSLFF